jgi:hypothetical protein
MRGLQAQVRQRGDRLGRQEGIDQLEQSISAAVEAPMQVDAKRAERCEIMSGHTAQPARKTGRWPPRPQASLPRVKSQAMNRFYKS